MRTDFSGSQPLFDWPVFSSTRVGQKVANVKLVRRLFAERKLLTNLHATPNEVIVTQALPAQTESKNVADQPSAASIPVSSQAAVAPVDTGSKEKPAKEERGEVSVAAPAASTAPGCKQTQL